MSWAVRLSTPKGEWPVEGYIDDPEGKTILSFELTDDESDDLGMEDLARLMSALNVGEAAIAEGIRIAGETPEVAP